MLMLPFSPAHPRPHITTAAVELSRGEVVDRRNAPTRREPRAVLAGPIALCILVCLPALAGCQYVDRARAASDAMVGVSQYYKVEALVQADIERRRLRKARCYSPLLTPSTISAAATDTRLGAGWVDELLADCPQFAAFLSELTFRRAASAGLVAARDLPAAEKSVTGQSGVQATAPHSPPATEP